MLSQKELIRIAVEQNKCALCKKPLQPFGDQRENGKVGRKDWATRKYHLACHRIIKARRQLIVPPPSRPIPIPEANPDCQDCHGQGQYPCFFCPSVLRVELYP